MTDSRDDTFVSICLPAWDAARGGSQALLTRIVDAIDARWRYWELLIASDADKAASLDPLLAAHRNLRAVLFQPGTPYYRRRVALAGEAIGDIVLVTSQDELAAIDPAVMIDQARIDGVVVVAQTAEGGLADRVVALLGRSAGFRVTGHALQSIALPRNQLNRILAQSDAPLALRFPPIDPAIRLSVRQVSGASGSVAGRWGQRLGLIQRLMVSTAPRVLTLVALASIAGAVLAALFAVYAVVVVLTFAHVQPGWFTTAILISVPAFFIGLANFGLAIGLIRVLDLLGGRGDDLIVGERGGADLFERAMADLNLEVADAVGRPAAR